MNDTELLAGFLAGTLESFPHRDHVRTAYLLLESRGFDEATIVLSDRIRAMAVAGGQPDKFHTTRTVAWMRLVAAAIEPDAAALTSDEFLLRRPHLLDSGLLNQYYSAELLGSLQSRARFVEPDLSPLN